MRRVRGVVGESYMGKGNGVPVGPCCEQPAEHHHLRCSTSTRSDSADHAAPDTTGGMRQISAAKKRDTKKSYECSSRRTQGPLPGIATGTAF